MRRLREKKKNNKGFTLVELIVVLVILAILAAILVPALLGYIDRAKQQQIVLNAKSCLTAAQAEFSDMYAQDTVISGDALTDDIKKSITTTADVPTNCTALTVGCAKKMDAKLDNTADKHAAYTITYVMYTEGGKTIYYNGSSWVTDKPTTEPTATYKIIEPKKE